jgi:FkbM family methyltransferase
VLRELKTNAASVVDRLGWEIRKKSAASTEPQLSHLESCLHLLMGLREVLNVVQVGANDGAINDPVYGFVSKYHDRTKILLCEPQPYLIPELEHNYAFTSNKYIFNGAVGPDPSLKLYGVRRECWDDLKVPYARGWPQYRAPTGVTSASYDHVLSWVSRHYTGKLQPNEVVEAITVDCVDMNELIERANFFDTIDVLQIDAEGFDDQIVYASNIDKFKPLLINLEIKHIPSERAKELRDFLAAHGYIFSQHGMDGLAIRTVGPHRQG